MIRVLAELRPACRVTQSADLSAAIALLEHQAHDVVVLAPSLADQGEGLAAQARATALGVGWITLLGPCACRPRRDIAPEDWDDTATPAGVQCLEELLDRLDDIGRRSHCIRPAPEATLPVRPDLPARSALAESHPRKVSSHRAPPVPAASGLGGRVVLIGASTGGIDALLTVLAHFPADCPPTAIVQHTGRGFSASLVRVLARDCAARVLVAEDGLRLMRGMIAVAGGLDGHLHLQPLPDRTLRCAVMPGDEVCGQVPSIDVMFRSALPCAQRTIAVLLTGMGADGAAGLMALREAGAMTIGQDEASSVVYGMPRVALELGAVRLHLPLDQIGPTILKLVQTPDPTARRLTP